LAAAMGAVVTGRAKVVVTMVVGGTVGVVQVAVGMVAEVMAMAG